MFPNRIGFDAVSDAFQSEGAVHWSVFQWSFQSRFPTIGKQPSVKRFLGGRQAGEGCFSPLLPPGEWVFLEIGVEIGGKQKRIGRARNRKERLDALLTPLGSNRNCSETALEHNHWNADAASLSLLPPPTSLYRQLSATDVIRLGGIHRRLGFKVDRKLLGNCSGVPSGTRARHRHGNA